MKYMLLDWAQKGCDLILDRYKFAPGQNAAPPLIIAHRGAWNLQERIENSLNAFKEAARVGAVGIEFDVRFTKDGIPVVLHDPSLSRLHGNPARLCDLTFQQVRAITKEIPLLSDVLALKGLHFMIEIKTPISDSQVKILSEHLTGIRPVQDFHFLVLDPQLVRASSLFPSQCWILVGELFLKPFVEISIARGLGGVAGQYLGMTENLVSRLHQAGQKAGVGFIPNRNLYNREWALQVDWVFSNDVIRLLK